MPKFANFVQCSLVAGITAGATTIQVEAQAPYNLPADPAGQTAYITLMDDLNIPTRFEIVGYTGVTTIDATSLELTGCTRGQQGTSAQAWAAGEFARQDVTGELFNSIYETPPLFYMSSEDTNIYGAFASGSIEPVWQNSQVGLLMVAVNPNGGFWAISDNYSLIKINKDFEEEFSVSLNGTIQTNNSLQEMAVHYNGDVSVRVNVSGTPRVKHFSQEDGSVLWEYTGNVPSLIKADKSGNLFVLEASSSTMARILIDGSVLWEANVSAMANSFGIVEGKHLIAVQGFTDVGIISYSGKVGSTLLTNLATAPMWIHPFADGSFAISDGATSEIKFYDASGALVSATGIDSVREHFFENKTFLVPGQTQSTVYDINGAVVTTIQNDINADVTWVDILGSQPIFVDGFERARQPVKYSNVTGIPQSHDNVVFAEDGYPGTPPAGKCVVYLDSFDGALKAKFSNGTTEIIASP